jgi:predicted phage tail protein
VVSGLANGTSYTFRVVAANNGGTGPASTPSDATVPGIPTVPTNVTAASGDTSAQVSWSAPATDGGSPITGYVVTPYLGAVPQTPVTVGLVTTASFSGLTNGSTYTFTVSAVNAVGTGPAATSNWVVPAVARPSAPDAPDPGPRPPDPTASGGGGIRPPVPPHH